jgi:Cd2+/Zn2+-exporting ATPase
MWYLAAYMYVASPVLKEGWEALKNKEFFTEFTLMAIATLGAFALGEYPEAVAVMLFYAIGELFQSAAVNKAKRSIRSLLDVRPSVAHVLRNGCYADIKPEHVNIGELIQVMAGEKVPLDGEMQNREGSFDTSAITGESMPRTVYRSQQVLAGMINTGKVVELKVVRPYADSSLARILHMVEHATARKAKTELFIRKFARIYTPIVFFSALALVLVPYLLLDHYVFRDWLYRALVFLVVSCPCALVISIPLGYFGGIGAASRHGILFKGANYLDLMSKVNTVVMDKTGTLTEGIYRMMEHIRPQM